MAQNIIGQVLGGQPKTGITAQTVNDVKNELGLTGSYTATIAGRPAEMSARLNDYDFVSFASAVKGAYVRK